MTVNINGNPLWGNNKKRYGCGCAVIDGKPYCPIHNKPIQEMIYGNYDNNEMLNEKERYEKQNLNE
jgi:hypothetical protein